MRQLVRVKYPVSDILLPLPPPQSGADEFEKSVYKAFMHSIRENYDKRRDQAVLCGIRATASDLRIGTALAAKTLCDLGLRGPQSAFPVSFIDFVDKATAIASYRPHTNATIIKISEYWEKGNIL